MIHVSQFVEDFLNETVNARQQYVSYYRWYIAYKIYVLGNRRSKNKRTVCDGDCIIGNSKLDEVSWIQCDNINCGTWMHKFCVKLKEDYTGLFMCNVCK